jgi:hypothetical protein
MTRPKDGDEKKCPRENCTDNAIFNEKTLKPGTGAQFVGRGGLVPPAAEYGPAWSCSCGYCEPISN